MHYDLDPNLWGHNENFALLHMSEIYTAKRVSNTLSFELKGIEVDFNQARVMFKDHLSAEQICVKIATAFATATLQV